MTTNENNIPKIKCKLCSASFPNLGTHINRKHRLSVAEYLRRFPEAEIMTKEHREKLSSSVKTRFLQNPELRKKVASRTFDFVKNKKLTPLLQRDYKTAKTCLAKSLWKPSIILYASIIEAVLIEKYPEAEDFYHAIKIAYKNRDFSEKEYYQINIVRDLRNFVHLHKEMSEVNEINDYWAKTFADICESIIKRFNKLKPDENLVHD